MSFVSAGKSPLEYASYYWPFDKIEEEDKWYVRENITKEKHEILNGGKIEDIKQLGKALYLGTYEFTIPYLFIFLVLCGSKNNHLWPPAMFRK